MKCMITIRLEESEREAINAATQAAGKSQNQWVLEKLLRSMEHCQHVAEFTKQILDNPPGSEHVE